ncbi:MAG: O-antigen ligase family protein [Gemmatimonadota bacterium]|nr:O-antigen ligase family protein [Gemmatimonadota bacterium]
MTSAPLKADFLVWSVAVALLSYVWRVHDVFPILGKLKFSLMITGILVFVYFLDSDRRRKLETVRHPISTVVVFITALIAISITTSLNRDFSFNLFVKDHLRNILLMAILVASVRGFNDLRVYVLTFIVGSLIFNQNVLRTASLDGGGRLIDVLYYDANDLAMLMAMTVPLILFFVVRGRPATKMFAVLCLAVNVLVFLRAGSRGGFLGLLAVGLYLLFQFSAVRKPTRFAAVGVIAVLMMTLAGNQFWGTMGTLLNLQGDYNMQGENGRKAVWLRGIDYMMQRPVTGVGFQAFPTAEGTISAHADRQMYGLGVKWSAAHNSFIQIGAELGISGLVAFLVLLGYAVFTAQRLGQRRNPDGSVPDEAVMAQGLVGAVIAYGVCGFFLSQAYACVSFMLFAMIVALDKVCRMKDTESARGNMSWAHGTIRLRG